MAASIQIVPFSNALNMYGGPDRHAAYSLSGQVNVTFSSSSSLFERKRPTSLILQSLVVTFEGQTEMISEEMGYSALRLCSISQQLVPEDWIELSNEDSRDLSAPCTWSMVFNLTIPGWLPESSAFGDREGGTTYALHAFATIHNNDAAPSRAWLSTLCSPFQPSVQQIKAPRVPVPLIRYTASSSHASGSNAAIPSTHYEVAAQLDEAHGETRFPRELLSKIRMQMSAPEVVDVDDESVPITIRLRTNGLPESDCRRLRVTEFHVNVEQTEKYRSRPMATFTSQFPVPPAPAQPPCRPLLHPHPLHSLYDMGLTATQPNSQLLRSFSLLPYDGSGDYKIAGDGYIFAHDADAGSDGAQWFNLSTQVPLSSTQPEPTDWKTGRVIRASGLSPFLSVSHRMYVTLLCTYDVLGAGNSPERVTERLRFHIPLKFVRVSSSTSPCGSRSSTPALVGHVRAVSEASEGSVASLVDMPLLSAPYASSLPAYSQLYYANGDRKIDYSVPLPLYTPRTDKLQAYQNDDA
ncbi:hypothetical protein PHLGIDRAFT_107449 [Phlebiopsis gigantea 11061_1 CR5-6]|uniref:Arrestin-like N-terminal domain-containing protein n=1 Tax=Phlebiopsis gigantea (strain 11061_1 CR5-6) TaxID=745531 RepID=A0A0C3PJ00_PHLG1|nr:hypothetical protein PHLGIDRAFT_107449 [Phlebiopsis gigantea 11061_1 CR5-6]